MEEFANFFSLIYSAIYIFVFWTAGLRKQDRDFVLDFV